MRTHKIAAISLSVTMAVAVFIGYFLLGERSAPILMNETLANSLISTGVKNVVMTVYLNYRLFDTLFEAMLLLVCVMGVQQFSKLTKKEKNYVDSVVMEEKNTFSTLMRQGLQSVYIFVFIFGFYIIISGINSPGGGFQGGGIVAAIVMSIHFSTGNTIITSEKAIVIEKVMFILLLILSTIFLALGQKFSDILYKSFLIIINFIIGIKVFCGFTILYLQFMKSGARIINKEKNGL